MFEIILGIAGVWILITGKVPGWIVGKKGFEIEGVKARLIGVILALPIPFSTAGGIILFLLVGKNAGGYAILLELAVFITVLIIVLILIRKFRTPIFTTMVQQ